jgi:deoxyribodipyrimidine photo-lyase
LTDIYWFQYDLRLQDNPGLLAHSNAERLLLVYCWPESRPWCNTTGTGEQRHRFLLESLQALQDDLAVLGQNLVILKGRPEVALPALARQVEACRIGTSLAPGFYERQARERLAAALPIPLEVYDGNTLYNVARLPFELQQMPAHFTPFQRTLERVDPLIPVAAPKSLPPPTDVIGDPVERSPCNPHLSFSIRGGSAAGQHRLQKWIFERKAILSYKKTRNGLDGLDSSSCVSPWLALGCLSAREIVAAVRRFESEVEANESTQWLVFELQWREFFHWRALADDVTLFRAGTIPGKISRCTFEPRNYARWCQGDTNFPLVNALMHQLVATGWMSNRGRQVAASCLVNEYAIDWRFGAAFFEKHLIDHDVASNYGNWQYLAGVGADPRGGRHFNLEKQANQFDPQGLFIAKWDGVRAEQPDFFVDEADWPLP